MTNIFKLSIKNFIILFISVINPIFSQSFSFLKTFPAINNRYYMVSSESLIFFNNYNNNYDIKHSFSEAQKIITEAEKEMISYGRFNEDSPSNLLIIKNYIYAISDIGNLYAICKIYEIDGILSYIIPIKCIDIFCYYSIAVKSSNNKLLLYYYINDLGVTCDVNIDVTNAFSEEYNLIIVSDNLSCHYQNNIICFYENNLNELIASIFNVDLTNHIIEYDSSYSKEIDGVKIIKSIISPDSTKFYVCYINNENLANCLIYNINTNQWSDKINFLNNCLPKLYSFNLQYFDSLNYYILSCYQSSTEFSFIKLNDNFEIINDDINGNYYLNETLIRDCSEYSLASLVNDTENNIIKIFGICETDINKYGIQKIIIPDNIPTEIPINTNIPNILDSHTSLVQGFIIIQEESFKTKEEIIQNLDEIILDYDFGKIYEIFGKDYNIKISPINSNVYNNISTFINFSNCENILRQKNGLSSSSILTVYQIEIDNQNEQTLINNVEYAVFNEDKVKLDLSVCENEKIEINYQINTSMINMTKVNYYSNLGINIFDINQSFFNDICYSYSEDDSDMILKDRVDDIYENYTICENNCEYEKINFTNNVVTCKCSVKTNTDSVIQSPKFEQMIVDSFVYSNFAVIICYNLVFEIKNKLSNIGFLIFSVLILAHIPIFIHYIAFNITSIKKFIFLEMNKFGYWCNMFNPVKKKNNNNRRNIIQSNNKDDNNKKSKDISSHSHLFYKSNKTSKYFKSKKIQKLITPYNNIITNSEANSNKTSNIKEKNKVIKLEEDNNNHKTKKKINIINNKNLNNNYINTDNEIENQNTKTYFEKNRTKNKELKNIKFSPEIYYLIQIDVNNIYNNIPIESNILLDNYDYETSIIYDKRSFCRIFYICLLLKGTIFNIIFFKTPLDLQSIRICLFIFVYSCDLAFNTIFYSNESISEKYHYEGNNLFLFIMINNIVQSISSSLISILIISLFHHLINTRGDFEELFKNEEKKMRENKKYKVLKETKKKILEKIRKIFYKLKCKIIIFFILEFSMMLFFYN